jgi:ferredoxin
VELPAGETVLASVGGGNYGRLDVKVVVDTAVCQGHARREDTASELFAVGNEDGARARLLLPAVPEDLMTAAEDAVFFCPIGTIKLVD